MAIVGSIIGIVVVGSLVYFQAQQKQAIEQEVAKLKEKEETANSNPGENIGEGQAISLIENLYYHLSEKNFNAAVSLYSPQLASQFRSSFFEQFTRVTVEDLQVTSRTENSLNLIGKNTYVWTDGSTQRESRSYTVRNIDGELKITSSEFIKVIKFR
jgi:serine/threonine-protein kinase